MFEQILKALKTKYAHLGLKENQLKVYATRLAKTVKEESEIASVISEVEDELKLLQSAGDEGRTRISQLEKELNELTEKFKKVSVPNPDEGKKDNSEPNNTPEWVKTLKEEFTKQQELVNAFIKNENQKTAQERFLAKLKDANVSESFYKKHLGRTFENDQQMEDFVKALKADEQEFLQKTSNDHLKSHTTPILGGGTKQGEVSADVQAIFNKKEQK